MSRQQSVLRNTVGYMLKNIDNQATNGEEKSKPEVIKLGFDLHARQVTECRQLDGSTPKPAQQWDPWKLLDKVEEWVKAGSKVYSCYEAGPCGYWYHRELTKLGAVNLRGGATATGKPTHQTSKDRSIGCTSLVRQPGKLSARKP